MSDLQIMRACGYVCDTPSTYPWKVLNGYDTVAPPPLTLAPYTLRFKVQHVLCSDSHLRL